MQNPWLSPLAVRIPLAGSSILADKSVLPSDRAHCSGWLISFVPLRMPRPCSLLLITERIPHHSSQQVPPAPCPRPALRPSTMQPTRHLQPSQQLLHRYAAEIQPPLQPPLLPRQRRWPQPRPLPVHRLRSQSKVCCTHHSQHASQQLPTKRP